MPETRVTLFPSYRPGPVGPIHYDAQLGRYGIAVPAPSHAGVRSRYLFVAYPNRLLAVPVALTDRLVHVKLANWRQFIVALVEVGPWPIPLAGPISTFIALPTAPPRPRRLKLKTIEEIIDA